MRETADRNRGDIAYRERCQVLVEELRLGMFVSGLDRPWRDSPYCVHGFLLKTRQEIKELQQLCSYVYIDIIRSKLGLDQPPKTIDLSEPDNKSSERKNQVSFQQEAEKAKVTYKKALKALQNVFEQVDKEDTSHVDDLKDVVKDCVSSIIRNDTALQWLALIDHHSHYLADHILRVTIYSLILGKEEGLSADQLELLGLSAALHDLGMLRIPEKILNKPGALTDAESALVRRHPAFGIEMLKAKGQLPEEVIEAVLCHHERLDGQGYPLGISAYAIPQLAKILAIADSYEALTSNRSYRPACSSLEALRNLMALRNTHYDERLVIKFVHCIRVYPIGSIVELTDGRIGIVLPCPYEHRMRPPLLMVMDEQGALVDEFLLELFKSEYTNLKIRRTLPDGSFGLWLVDYCDHPLIYS